MSVVTFTAATAGCSSCAGCAGPGGRCRVVVSWSIHSPIISFYVEREVSSSAAVHRHYRRFVQTVASCYRAFSERLPVAYAVGFIC